MERLQTALTLFLVFDPMELLQTSLTLFLVFDPFGNAPVFHGVLSRVPEPSRFRVLLRELLIAYALLLVVLLAGEPIMAALGLESPALGIAGGILLFLIALGMVFPAKSVLHEPGSDEPFIVPLAVPLIAGPSAIAILLLVSSRHPGFHAPSLVALTLAWAASSSLLLLSPVLLRLLGTKGTRALERLMGLVLIMVSVQIFLDGLEAWTKRG
jgi:multiple antibiotic resistance protein